MGSLYISPPKKDSVTCTRRHQPRILPRGEEQGPGQNVEKHHRRLPVRKVLYLEKYIGPRLPLPDGERDIEAE